MGACGEGIGGLAPGAFDPAPVAIALTTGPRHRLAYTNAAYRAYFGDHPLGRPIQEAFGGAARTDRPDLFDRVLDTGEAVTVTEARMRLGGIGTGRAERFFTFSLSRFREDPPGVLVIAVDVTEQVAATRRAVRSAEEQQRFRRRLESLVRVAGTSAPIMWVTGPGGGVIEPSPGWEKLTGQTWEEFRGNGWLRALHPDDRDEAKRSRDQARREERPWRYVYRLRTVDGEYRHFEVRTAPVYQNGVLTEWIGACVDIEQQWREERRRDLIDRAAAAIAESSGLPEMFGALADVLVPVLADGCGVHLLPNFGDRPAGATVVAQRIATAAQDGMPRQPPLGYERFAADSAFTRAVERRRPLHRTFPPGEPPAGVFPESTTSWLATARANSVVLMPVVVNGAVAAAVTAARCGDRAPMTPEDVDLMRQMFDRTHDALSNAVQAHRTQQVALALQDGLLPDPPRLTGMAAVARYRPSPAAAEVGGDWYDCFVLPDGATVLAIGDVTGHDLAAAVGMSQLRNMLRGLTVDRAGPPGETLRRLNMAMQTLVPDSTATAVLGRVTTGPGRRRLDYASAGHPPPLLVTADGGARLLEDAANPLLGYPFDEPYGSATEALPPGATLLLYTDGLVERPGEHLDIGLERLRERASALARDPLDTFCDTLLDGLPTTGTDDIAVIALRVTDAS
ncbi:SpoIIE family protein phosphatase [Actinomadura sp. WMMB 499]|uniref:SpoIIE family protein phosphatase n=1 Tax=Actinomadura sp. WMMB 499 TaxID=1219491 RepID=UPI00124771A6|nr:SpoIIE family protein phosphatase [Actinomadura sp. WMMB 499]QFG22291.1 SpoIIE family protein phosphatase [Actinomadura sp. WMMB 499]